jgi:hypothetical protein
MDWRPKKQAIAGPRRVRATSANRIDRGAASIAWSWTISPIQGSAATSATTAQVASPTRQPPYASEIGTVNTSAAVRPTASAVV